MKPNPKILVATEVGSDAEMIRRLLNDEFDKVEISIDADSAIKEFETFQPDVLVLAFNNLEKAERYYLGLYRLSTVVHVLPHRTLILCNKDDLRRVYDLCKREYFDDYVLFWPMTNDSPRLLMAIHHAMRELAAAAMPAPGEIAVQARRLVELEAQVERYAESGGQRINLASQSLHRAEREISEALDHFSHKLSQREQAGTAELKDRKWLQREINKLKAEEIEKHFHLISDAVQPMQRWASELKQELAPQLASAKALSGLVERYCPVVLVVEDDEFQHKAVNQILKGMDIELVFAISGMGALNLINKHRPSLILMDIDLPDIDGIEVTRRLKSTEQFAQIPVLMITGHSEKSIVVNSLKAGAADFAVKPFDQSTLRGKVEHLLGS